MAKKLTENQWEKVRIDREIHCLSLSVIAKKYGIGRATIADRSKKYGWSQQKTAENIDVKKAKINAVLMEKPNNIPNNIPNTAVQKTERYDAEINSVVMMELSEPFIMQFHKLQLAKHLVAKGAELAKDSKSGQDYKAVIEGLDRLSILVGANPRHASTTINNTANAQAGVQVQIAESENDL